MTTVDKPDSMTRVIQIICVIALVGAVAYVIGRQLSPETSVQKYNACVKTAGQTYDNAREAIATRNTDTSSHEYYYQQTTEGYAGDLARCRQTYPPAQ